MRDVIILGLFKSGTSCIWLIFGNISFSNVFSQLQTMFGFSRRLIDSTMSEFINLFIILLKHDE